MSSVIGKPQIVLSGSAIGIVGMLAIMGGGPFLVAGTVLLCLVAIWSLIALRRRQLLALTPTRVVVEMPGAIVEVPWAAGVDAEIYPMPSGQATVDMIGLIAAHPAAATWTRGRVIGLVHGQMSDYVVSVPADSFAGQGEDVVAAIRHYAADPAARRRIAGAEEHSRLLRVLGETDPDTECAAAFVREENFRSSSIAAATPRCEGACCLCLEASAGSLRPR